MEMSWVRHCIQTVENYVNTVLYLHSEVMFLSLKVLIWFFAFRWDLPGVFFLCKFTNFSTHAAKSLSWQIILHIYFDTTELSVWKERMQPFKCKRQDLVVVAEIRIFMRKIKTPDVFPTHCDCLADINSVRTGDIFTARAVNFLGLVLCKSFYGITRCGRH
jgi:hypothetical protein